MDGVAAQDTAKVEYRRRNDAETAVAVKKQVRMPYQIQTTSPGCWVLGAGTVACSCAPL
jgi:hypothetical protein